jgi:hypothetical protein
VIRQGRTLSEEIFFQGYPSGPFGLKVAHAMAAAIVWAFWRIFSKARCKSTWGSAAVLPFAQVFLLLSLAVAADWARGGQPAEGDA